MRQASLCKLNYFNSFRTKEVCLFSKIENSLLTIERTRDKRIPFGIIGHSPNYAEWLLRYSTGKVGSYIK